MENSSPVTSETPKEKKNSDLIIFGVVVGVIYSIPPVSFFILVVPYIALFLSFYIWGDKVDDNGTLVTILFVLLFLVSALIVALCVFFSGRAAYRSLNVSGSIWDTVIGVFISVIVFFVGAVIFSAISIFGLGYFYESSATSDDWAMGAFLVGIVVGVAVAYIVALISMIGTLKILGRRSAQLEDNNKIEEGSK